MKKFKDLDLKSITFALFMFDALLCTIIFPIVLFSEAIWTLYIILGYTWFCLVVTLILGYIDIYIRKD